MQKINYPIIVSDFDGTLVNDDGTISIENKNAIEKYTKDGGVFAISTGRLHYGILSRAKELGLKEVDKKTIAKTYPLLFRGRE